MDAYVDYEYFTFRSITRAQLALYDLQAAGIAAVLQRTPRALAGEGCGYAIRVRSGAGERTEELFGRHAVPYQRRFRRQQGQYREVTR